MERQNDECCKKRKKNGTNDIVAVAVSLKWKWGGHVARLDRRRWEHAASMWGLRTGKMRMGATEEPMGQDTFKRVAGQWSRAAKNRTELSRYNIRETDVIKLRSDVSRKWLHQCNY